MSAPRPLPDGDPVAGIVVAALVTIPLWAVLAAAAWWAWRWR